VISGTLCSSYAYVADRDVGLRVIDVSAPSSPIEVGLNDTPRKAHGVAAAGGYVYVADDKFGIEIFDASHCPGGVREMPTPRRATGRRRP
jgi:hypothetical protein